MVKGDETVVLDFDEKPTKYSKVMKAITKLVLPISILCMVLNVSYAQNSTVTDSIKQYIQENFEDFSSSSYSDWEGVAVTITYNGTFWSTGIGKANDTGQPIDTKGRWLFRSFSKLIVSTVILQLHEEGQLDIDDPLSKYLDPIEKVSMSEPIKDLLQMRSSMCQYLNSTQSVWIKVAQDPEAILDTKTMLEEHLLDESCNWTKAYNYNEANFQVLGLVIEAVTGKTGEEVFAERIFEPFGMDSTSLAPIGLERSRFNGLYSGDFQNPNAHDQSEISLNSLLTSQKFSGGVMGSTEDMLKFLKHLMDGDILKPETLELMKTNPLSSSYGMGMMIQSMSGMEGNVPVYEGTYYGHGGGGLNTSRTFYDPVRKIGFSYAYNSGSSTGQSNWNTELFKETLYYYLRYCIERGACTDERSFYQRKEDWISIIDEAWGGGASLADKQEMFNTFADNIENIFPAFAGLDLDWEEHRASYYAQITEETSKGRFSGIMSNLAYSLKELHVRMWDELVTVATEPTPGTPIYALNTFDVSHFGASLTTQPDSSLLVVNVIEDHPLGLVPGDVVLGYEGKPWKELTHELFESDIPSVGWLGSSEAAISYHMLANAGMNWHLFNTIDIVKYETGDTLSYSTEPLSELLKNGTALNGWIYNNPQLLVPGVEMPNLNLLFPVDAISYGKVEGTNIGYIYVNSHDYDEVDQEFLAAVQALMDTEGLIIDLRWNGGGYINLTEGIKLLFKEWSPPLESHNRCSESNFTELCTYPPASGWFNITVDPNTFYEGKIAVLTGPTSQSFGDYATFQLSTHPNAKTFGLPSNGAYSGTTTAARLSFPGWHTNTPNYVLVDPDNSSELLVRNPEPVDEKVWLIQEDVVKGLDTVVEKALNWMGHTLVGIEDESSDGPSGFKLEQNYPNPFNPSTVIRYELAENSNVSLKVFDLLGREVATLVEGRETAGRHSVRFDATGLASGMYLYQLNTEQGLFTKKMLLLK